MSQTNFISLAWLSYLRDHSRVVQHDHKKLLIFICSMSEDK